MAGTLGMASHPCVWVLGRLRSSCSLQLRSPGGLSACSPAVQGGSRDRNATPWDNEEGGGRPPARHNGETRQEWEALNMGLKGPLHPVPRSLPPHSPPHSTPTPPPPTSQGLGQRKPWKVGKGQGGGSTCFSSFSKALSLPLGLLCEGYSRSEESL